MKRKEYSAGAVKMSFWFIEFRKVVQLLHDGKTNGFRVRKAENFDAGMEILNISWIGRTMAIKLKTSLIAMVSFAQGRRTCKSTSPNN